MAQYQRRHLGSISHARCLGRELPTNWGVTSDNLLLGSVLNNLLWEGQASLDLQPRHTIVDLALSQECLQRKLALSQGITIQIDLQAFPVPASTS